MFRLVDGGVLCVYMHACSDSLSLIVFQLHRAHSFNISADDLLIFSPTITQSEKKKRQKGGKKKRKRKATSSSSAIKDAAVPQTAVSKRTWRSIWNNTTRSGHQYFVAARPSHSERFRGEYTESERERERWERPDKSFWDCSQVRRVCIYTENE